MIDFFKTAMGKRYYEGTLPKLVDAAQSIARELKRYNDAQEQSGYSESDEARDEELLELADMLEQEGMEKVGHVIGRLREIVTGDKAG